jgi:hypothetical protein
MASCVGYKLINLSDGSIAEQWGGIWGQCPGVPNFIVLPSGIQISCMKVDQEYDGYKLVAWEIEPPPLTETDYANAIQERIEEEAKSRSYSNAVTCSSYAQSTNPKWSAEAVAFIAWRDAVWNYVFAQLTAVQSGSRPQPTVEEILLELPIMSWPA